MTKSRSRTTEFPHVAWDDATIQDCRTVLAAGLREDLGDVGDLTTEAVIPPQAIGAAQAVARAAGVVAGVHAANLLVDLLHQYPLLREWTDPCEWSPSAEDGQTLAAGSVIGVFRGSARKILILERTFLNLLGRLSGIATLTRKYVDALSGYSCRVYDTRKTTPGWRRLEKYAVRCGGGWNHRLGLAAAPMIKDNHLAWRPTTGQTSADRLTVGVQAISEHMYNIFPQFEADRIPIEVEVDRLDQLPAALATPADIVLLDNMSLDELRKAVALRNRLAPDRILEASGGVNLQTVGPIAATGVDRVSVGGLTHSAPNWDVGLDWVVP